MELYYVITISDRDARRFSPIFIRLPEPVWF